MTLSIHAGAAAPRRLTILAVTASGSLAARWAATGSPCNFTATA
jgi:hypothetical protein